METSQGIIAELETHGLTVKDIVELSGISQPTISMIKNGQRSGKTSLPALQRLLNSQETYSYTQPSTIIESSLASIDDVPISQSRAIQPYTASISPQDRHDRGMAYRQARNRYGVTPDEMMEEIQGLRFQLNEMSHQFKQQQRQGISQARKKKDESEYYGISWIELLGAISNEFVVPALKERLSNKQLLLNEPRQAPSQPYQETRQAPLQPTTYQAPSQQPYYEYRRQGRYGLPSSRQTIQEETPSQWKRFKMYLGFGS